MNRPSPEEQRRERNRKIKFYLGCGVMALAACLWDWRIGLFGTGLCIAFDAATD